MGIFGSALLAASLSGCDYALMDPHGPIGRQEKLLLIDSTVIMLAIVVPVIILTLVFAWWFRADNPRATRLPDWDYSGRIEFIVWAIPALVILFLGGITWISCHDLIRRLPSHPRSRRWTSKSFRWTGNGCSSIRMPASRR